MGSKPIFLLLLDARKEFDKVAYNVLYNLLLDKSLCDKIVKWLFLCTSIFISHVMLCVVVLGLMNLRFSMV